jgi:hypothetical protein
MKPKSNKWLILILAFTIVLQACNADALNKKSEAAATEFYNDLQKKDFLAALALCSDKAFSEDSRDKWVAQFRRNNILLGEVKSFTKTSGFNVSTSTNVGTTVTVTYDVQCQYGLSRDSLQFIKEKDGNMKLFRYAWKHTDADYIKGVSKSAEEAKQYIDAIKNNNYDAAIALCSDEALRTTPKENWARFLDNANQQLGPITDYHIVRDSSAYDIQGEGQSGPGNYYDIYIQSSRGEQQVMEKIVFYQKNYAEPLKLVGHKFL